MSERLRLAVENGHVVLPEGEIAVFGVAADSELSVFDKARTTLFKQHRDVSDKWTHAGWQGVWEFTQDVAASVVFLPRARDLQRAFIREAARISNGPIVVDGSKTNGVDALYREIRSRASVSEAWSKAHGKDFVIDGGAFDDWPELAPFKRADGWWSAPGIFSADGPDKASQLLAESLPPKMEGSVVDLGSGSGFLAKEIRSRDGVGILTLVENDRLAHQAGLKNALYERHNYERNVHKWADARVWRPEGKVNHVVTNPPFHTSRKAEPELGRAFIRSAADMLATKGSLWLVANRHLPYEKALEDAFHSVQTLDPNPSFKIFHATSPKRRKG